MKNLEGKVAIITGAGSGIGRALGEEMARRGAYLVVSDVNRDRIEEVGESIEKAGGKVKTLTLDVSCFDAVKKMVDHTAAEHGRIDYIFNNAGIVVGGEARDISIEDWRTVIDVNLYGVINGVAAVYPIMAKQGFGHVVNLGSIEGLVPFPGTASYVGSKYGVVGLSNSLRIEAEPLGVKVSVVCPGHIKTSIFQDARVVKLDRDKMLFWMTASPGMTPGKCALKILRGVERNKAVIVITNTARILWYMYRICPGLVFLVMKIGYRKIMPDVYIDD